MLIELSGEQLNYLIGILEKPQKGECYICRITLRKKFRDALPVNTIVQRET